MKLNIPVDNSNHLSPCTIPVLQHLVVHAGMFKDLDDGQRCTGEDGLDVSLGSGVVCGHGEGRGGGAKGEGVDEADTRYQSIGLCASDSQGLELEGDSLQRFTTGPSMMKIANVAPQECYLGCSRPIRLSRSYLKTAHGPPRPKGLP